MSLFHTTDSLRWHYFHLKVNISLIFYNFLLIELTFCEVCASRTSLPLDLNIADVSPARLKHRGHNISLKFLYVDLLFRLKIAFSAKFCELSNNKRSVFNRMVIFYICLNYI